MTRTRRHAAVAGTALLAAGLLLAGCSAPSPEAEEPDPAEFSSAVETPGADPATCLVGDWDIPEDELQSFYDAVTADSGGEPSFEVTGGTGLEFTETTYVYTPDIVLEMDFGGTAGAGTITGTIAGDYMVVDGVILTQHDENDISSELTVGGRTVDGSEIIGALLSSHPFHESPYECTGDTVVIQFSTGSGRTAVELVPAS